MLRNIRLAAVLASCLFAARVERCSAQAPQGKQPGFRRLGAPGGIQRYVPGAWGVVAAELINPTDHPVDLLATTYFEGESDKQYARQSWVPAGARRLVWYQVQAPEKRDREATLAELKSLVFDRTGPTEVLLKPPSGQILYSERATFDEGRSLTGFITPPIVERDVNESTTESIEDDFAFEAAVALRTGVKLSRQIITLREGQIPATPEGLDGLTHLVLSNDHIAIDAAGVAALRRWLHRGGRLWIQLDRVDSSTVLRLLGDEFDCQIVDRVGLNNFEIQDVPQTDSPPVHVSLEKPAEFLRVFPGQCDVTHQINGWPASFWMRYGRGQVMFTSLAPEGWIRLRTKLDPPPRDSTQATKFLGTDPFDKLATRFFQPSEPAPGSSERFRVYSQDQVGYRIVGRSLVSALLAAFCGCLTVAGIWLTRKERSEMLGWLGPVAAMITAAVLVVLGVSARQAVPPTVAVTQFIDTAPGTAEALVSGVAAVYNSDTVDFPLGTHRGGMLHTDETVASGQTRRMILTDIDSWHWEKLPLRAGVSPVEFDTVLPLKKPALARGTFGPEGFEGKLTPGPLENLDDALLVGTLGQRLAMKVGGDHRLSAGVQNSLSSDQYLASTFVTDTQRQRMAIYRSLFENGRFVQWSAHPTLLAWVAPLETGIDFPENMQRKGAALVALPILLERPAAGATVAIPSPFLTVRDVSGPPQLAGSRQTYDFRKGAWSERPSPARTWLRFELPKEAIPLEIQNVVLSIQLSAPGRTLEIEGLLGNKAVSLARQENPIGLHRFTIDRADILQLDDRGGLTLGINIADQTAAAADPRDSGGAENIWKIEFVNLDIHGKIPSR